MISHLYPSWCIRATYEIQKKEIEGRLADCRVRCGQRRGVAGSGDGGGGGGLEVRRQGALEVAVLLITLLVSIPHVFNESIQKLRLDGPCWAFHTSGYPMTSMNWKRVP
jgi:hypothetical protein